MALKSFISKNRGLAILILAFVAVKLITVLQFRFLVWDEAVYLAMGKYLYSAGQSGFFEIIRPIGLPIAIGWLWSLKANYILLSKILSIIFSAAYVAVSYIIAKKIFSKKTAIIASLLIVITPVFFGLSSLILTDIPATLFVLLAFYFFVEKRNMFLCGLFTALAFTFRFPAGLILVIICLLMLLRYFQEKAVKFVVLIKNYVVYGLSFILFMVPYVLFNYFEYRNDTSILWHVLFRPWIMGLWHQNNPSESVLTGTLLSRLYNVFYYPLNMIAQNLFLVFAILALVYWFSRKQYRNFRFNALAIVFIIFLAYFSCILNKQVRFSLMFLPFTAMLAAYGLSEAYSWLRRKRQRLALVIVIVLCLLQALAITMAAISSGAGYLLKNPVETKYDALAKFFTEHNISGTVISTDPLPAAYLDNKLNPIFYSYDVLVKTFESDPTAGTMIYYAEGIWCAEQDTRCLAERERTSEYLMQNYNLVFYNSTNKMYVFSKDFTLPSLNQDRLSQVKVQLLMNPRSPGPIVSFRIENAGSLYREDGKGSIWKLSEFRKLNSIFNGTKVTWSIIPADVLGLNNASKAYLVKAGKGTSIAQRGYDYQDNGRGSEFAGLSYSAQLDKIKTGREILEKAFSQRITTFIPPFNSGDENTIKALAKLNYTVYSSTPGDFLYVKDTGVNRYDQEISFTDWQAGKNLGFDELKQQFDSLSKYKDYVIISVEYYMLSDKDFGTLARFRDYVKSKNTEIMDLNGLDQWYRFRDTVNFSVNDKSILLNVPQSSLADMLTIGFYYPGNFTLQSNAKSVNIINLNDKDITVCLNNGCSGLKPQDVKIVEIKKPA